MAVLGVLRPLPGRSRNRSDDESESLHVRARSGLCGLASCCRSGCDSVIVFHTEPNQYFDCKDFTTCPVALPPPRCSLHPSRVGCVPCCGAGFRCSPRPCIHYLEGLQTVTRSATVDRPRQFIADWLKLQSSGTRIQGQARGEGHKKFSHWTAPVLIAPPT